MLRLGQERPEIRVVADQIGSPTWSQDIATAIAQFIRVSARKKDAFYANEEVQLPVSEAYS